MENEEKLRLYKIEIKQLRKRLINERLSSGDKISMLEIENARLLRTKYELHSKNEKKQKLLDKQNEIIKSIIHLEEDS
jgi:hypothetical protein